MWSTIRLELARTPDFPSGSASRAYMLRVPLDKAGFIDAKSLASMPAMATVRRFWPNEPDRSGYLIQTGAGWGFSYAIGEDDDENVSHLELHPLRVGEYVTVTEPTGERLPFRVTTAQSNGSGAGLP